MYYTDFLANKKMEECVYRTKMDLFSAKVNTRITLVL
jgi:hypothetical protein